jgi:hypothetical protein
MLGQRGFERLVERGHAVVVEAAGHGAEHRQGVGCHVEGRAVALHLLGHVAQRVLCAPAVELVDGHELREVQHVDLLELAGGAELGRHHVHGDVDQRHDGRVALADARGLADHQVKAGRLACGDAVGQGLADLGAEIARGQGAHEDARAAGPGRDGVHADAVAQQRAAALAPARVHRQHGDAQTVVLVEAQAADQLVGQRALACAAGAGDAQHRGLLRHLGQLGLEAGVGLAVLQRGERLRQRAPGGLAMALQRRDGLGRVRREVVVTAHDHLADHSLQAHALPVLGAEDAHAMLGQVGDLGWDDHATAAAEHLDVRAAPLLEQLHHVLEVLDVAALVGADRDALHVLLQRGGHHLVHRAVVPEVDHLGTHALQDAPHDVDGGVVAVEQAGGGDEAHLVGGLVVGERLEFG